MRALIALALLMMAPKEPELLRTSREQWPAEYQTYVETWRTKEVTATEEQLAAAKRAAVKNRDANSGKLVRELQARLKSLKHKKHELRPEPALYVGELAPYVGPRPKIEPEKGEMGRLRCKAVEQYRVVQVLNSQSALVSPEMLDFTRREYVALEPFLLRGIDTTSWRDEEVVDLLDIYQCVGSETYATVNGGTRTSLVIEPVAAAQQEPPDANAN